MATRSPPIEFFSDDPEVMALQAMIKGLRHVNKKPALTGNHLKVLAAVKVSMAALGGRPVTAQQIEMFLATTDDAEFRQCLSELVDQRYVHEAVNTYGKVVKTYKIGPMGGTLLRNMFGKPGPKKKAANGEFGTKDTEAEKRAG